jgi:hypothetical protein
VCAAVAGRAYSASAELTDGQQKNSLAMMPRGHGGPIWVFPRQHFCRDCKQRAAILHPELVASTIAILAQDLLR